MIDLEALLDVVRREATGIRSPIHGEQHWKAVARAGLDVAAHTPGADRSVVFLFALLSTAAAREPRRLAESLAYPRGEYDWAELARVVTSRCSGPPAA